MAYPTLGCDTLLSVHTCGTCVCMSICLHAVLHARPNASASCICWSISGQFIACYDTLGATLHHTTVVAGGQLLDVPAERVTESVVLVCI